MTLIYSMCLVGYLVCYNKRIILFYHFLIVTKQARLFPPHIGHKAQVGQDYRPVLRQMIVHDGKPCSHTISTMGQNEDVSPNPPNPPSLKQKSSKHSPPRDPAWPQVLHSPGTLQ